MEEDAAMPADVANPTVGNDGEVERTEETATVTASQGDKDTKKDVKLEDLFDDDDSDMEVDDSIFTPTCVHHPDHLMMESPPADNV